MRKIYVMTAGIMLAASLFVQSGLAQITTSRVDGVVTDASGAVVPGATVKLINNRTEFTNEQLTNNSGLYVFPQVAPGYYRIIVEKAGFKVGTVGGVEVNVNTPRTINVQLEIGDVSQSIEVTADLAGMLINTVNAELNTIVDREQIENLPLIGRNPTEFALMQAGVTARGEGAREASVNGMRGTYQNLTLDGINNQDNFIRTDGFFGIIPVTESFVEEFNLTTANSDVDAGIGSSQTKMITRSGSNEFHVEAFYYHRNSSLNANNFFNNAAGVPRPHIRNHQYGFNVGGPIVKNKLFFFVNWEEERDPSAPSVVRTVLTEQARNGSFTYLRSDSSELETLNLLTLGDATPDPVIADLLDVVAEYPINDSSVGDGTNTAGFRFNSPANATNKWLSFKVDYQPVASHTISAVLHQFRYNLPNDPYNDVDSVFPGLPGMGQKSSRYLGTVSLNSIVAPTITNEIRFGMQYAPVEFFTNEKFTSGYRLDLPLIDNPVQNFMGQGRNAPVYELTENLNWVKGNHTLKFGGSIRWTTVDLFNDEGIVPEYTLDFGYGNLNPLHPSMFPGGINDGAFSRATDQLALLGGFVDSAEQTFNVESRTSGFVDGYTHSRIFGQRFFNLYSGDTWRMKPNLSVNIGLRWEYHGLPNETRGLALLPVFGSYDVLNSNAILNFAGRGTKTNFYHRDLNNFVPSVGFSWRPFKGRSTVIRAGYSISYVNDSNVASVRNAVGGNDGLTQNVALYDISGTVSGDGLVPIETPVFMVPRTLRDNILLDGGSGIFTIKNDLRTPYVQQWNLSLQHEIFKDTALEVRYVGNRGVKLIRAIDHNQMMLPQEFLDDFTRARNNLIANGDPYVGEELTMISQLGSPYAIYGYGPGLLEFNVNELLTNQIGSYLEWLAFNRWAFFAGEGGEWFGATLPISPFYRNTNAFFGDELGNFSYSNYHALQVELRKRFSSGLGFQVNYTFGKVLTNFGGSQSNFNAFMDNAQQHIEKMRPDFDITHTFNGNFVYDLPFGRDRFFNIQNRVLNTIAGGWNLSGIVRIHSGEVISIVSQRATINRPGRSGKNTVNMSGMTIQELQDKTGVFQDSEGRMLMFDPSLIAADGTASDTYFANPDLATAGTLGLAPISGPWYFTTNLTLSKRFDLPIREGSAFEITAYLNNIFNRTNFDVGATPDALDPEISIYNAQDINSTSFGLISSAFSPREAQLGIKVIF